MTNMVQIKMYTSAPIRPQYFCHGRAAYLIVSILSTGHHGPEHLVLEQTAQIQIRLVLPV